MDKAGAERLPGMSFSLLFKELEENAIKHIRVEVTEIVDWDMAPMRKFFHAVVLPAFVNKYNETSSCPNGGHYDKDVVKAFLKAKFLGYPVYEDSVWWKILQPTMHTGTIEEWIAMETLNKATKMPFEPSSTKILTPEGYMKLINDCEAYYFTLFNTTYDISQKPKVEETY